MRSLNLRPQIAMAIYAHPDDADVAAGGLLAQWAQDGCAVHLVVVCDGDKGSHVLTADAGAVREVRGAEVEFAADLLGATTVTRLARPDGEADNDVDLRAALVGLIRQYRPEVVIGPDPTATFFAGVYVNHRDHRETGWAMLDAVAPAAAMPTSPARSIPK
jgi:LmbE family N-acetylglucosaminyl deacetylase